MKESNDIKTVDLFPENVIISRLMCVGVKARETKDAVFFELKIKGITTATRESDLCPNDYLIAAAELLVEQCANSERLAKEFINRESEKRDVESLVELMAGARRPVVKNGTITMTFETMIDFEYLGVIVEKETLIKMIARWVLTLAKADVDEANAAINDAYLRIINRDAMPEAA